MAQTNVEDVPVRGNMDDAAIQWRYKKAPNYDAVNKVYLEEKTKNHPPGSQEKAVENIVKQFEMEVSHQTNPKDWKTVDSEVFTVRSNDGPTVKSDELVKIGTYNAFLQDCPFYDTDKETFDTGHDLFKGCFPKGFAWELVEIFSGPPTIVFSWRHWAHYNGPYKNKEPTGELLEMTGTTIATTNAEGKMTNMQHYFDPNPIILKLTHSWGKGAAKCPFAGSS